MSKTKKQNRIISIDVLRGIAVFLMVLAHCIAFLVAGRNLFWHSLQDTGDFLCFTIFLFVSGIATYIAYVSLDKEEWKLKRGNILKRNLIFLIGYYVVAFFAALKDLNIPIDEISFKWIIEIFLFINVPSYTEFLLPFIFYGFLIVLFKDFFFKIIRSKITFIIIIVLSFSLGAYLYGIDLVYPLSHYKAILAGEPGLYRFPILQYFPVFIYGMYLGRYILKFSIENGRFKLYLKHLLVLVLITFSSFILSSRFSVLNDFERWPPSIMFISFGLAVSLALLIIIEAVVKELSIENALKPLLLLGKTAFGIFIVHDIILHINELSFSFKTDNSLVLIIFFFIILILSTLIGRNLNWKRKINAKK